MVQVLLVMLKIVLMRDKALHDAADKLPPTRPVDEMVRGENVCLSVFTSLPVCITYKALADMPHVVLSLPRDPRRDLRLGRQRWNER